MQNTETKNPMESRLTILNIIISKKLAEQMINLKVIYKIYW